MQTVCIKSNLFLPTVQGSHILRGSEQIAALSLWCRIMVTQFSLGARLLARPPRHVFKGSIPRNSTKGGPFLMAFGIRVADDSSMVLGLLVLGFLDEDAYVITPDRVDQF